jgi:hypothetical protein
MNCKPVDQDLGCAARISTRPETNHRRGSGLEKSGCCGLISTIFFLCE